MAKNCLEYLKEKGIIKDEKELHPDGAYYLSEVSLERLSNPEECIKAYRLVQFMFSKSKE